MGYTSYHAEYYKNGKIDRKAEVESQFENDYHEHIKSVLVGSTVYSAVKDRKTGEVFGVVTLTSIDMKDYYNFSYKMMDETEGPYYYDCPESILKLLTPTENKEAMNWRTVCWNKLEQKKAKKNDPYSLNNLPIGSVIRFKYGDGIMELVKQPASYQFKKPFWLNEESWKYCPVNRIPDDYEVVSPIINEKVEPEVNIAESETTQYEFNFA